MDKFFIEVTRFIADIHWVNGKPTPSKKKIEAKYTLEQIIYEGKDRNELKNEFITSAANKVRANNVMEENKVKQKHLSKMQVWVITNIE